MKAKDKVWLSLWGNVEPAKVVAVEGTEVVVRYGEGNSRVMNLGSVYKTKQEATAATLQDRIKSLRKELADLQEKQGAIIKGLQSCIEALDSADYEPTETVTFTKTIV